MIYLANVASFQSLLSYLEPPESHSFCLLGTPVCYISVTCLLHNPVSCLLFSGTLPGNHV